MEGYYEGKEGEGEKVREKITSEQSNRSVEHEYATCSYCELRVQCLIKTTSPIRAIAMRVMYATSAHTHKWKSLYNITIRCPMCRDSYR